MKKLDNAMGRFELDGVTYTMTKTGYCYKTTGKFDKKGQPINMRIAKHVYEERFEQYLQTADDNADWDAAHEVEDRKDRQEQEDRQTEENFNGKKEKKVRKPRRSKDVAVTITSGTGHEYTITAKQADFLRHLPDTCFWEHGLESALWCDVLADEIGGQFADKPMTVGAMISTLREKALVEVCRDDTRKGKPKYIILTTLGKAFAKELGLE